LISIALDGLIAVFVYLATLIVLGVAALISLIIAFINRDEKHGVSNKGLSFIFCWR